MLTQVRRNVKREIEIRRGSARLAVIALLLTIAAGQLLASPPDSIRLSFDTTSHTLSVAVFHTSRNISAHHINKITVALDDKLVITQEFASQTSNTEQDASYTIIDAGPNTKLTVDAFCNIYGQGTETLVIPADAPPGGGR
jgi:desulfoferrodoxin (superoxide reductase-like protein)